MKICMIGAGYVGLVTGACFSDLGNTVYCVDNDKKKIDMLNSGEIPIYEPGLSEIIEKNYLSNRLKFTSDLLKAVRLSDIVFICVGTPTSKKNKFIGHIFSGKYLDCGSIKGYINSSLEISKM